jgi:hypothetical protein
MKLAFSIASPADAIELAALHTAVAEDLTRRDGHGSWSTKTSEKGALLAIRNTRVMVARKSKTIVGTLNLPTKKPWAIDVSYCTSTNTGPLHAPPSTFLASGRCPGFLPTL